MAFVRVTPYYEQNNPKPVMLRFNEIIPKKTEAKIKEEKPLFSVIRQEEEL